jgi:predicted nucleotidyltransferase
LRAACGGGFGCCAASLVCWPLSNPKGMSILPLAGRCDKGAGMNSIKQKARAAAVIIFESTPVLFAYVYGSYAGNRSHPFSDLDVGIFVEGLTIQDCLDLELSLALQIDEKLDHTVQAEVRVLNQLPLRVIGNILGEAELIYSRAEEKRIEFETHVRMAYFDFLPVIRQHHRAYQKKSVSGSCNGIG